MSSRGQPGPGGRRGPSGAWGRLKPPSIDPLDVYGLPSKGETRLNSFKAQEAYYNKIVERYMKFCAAANGPEELERQFAALSMQATSSSTSSANGTKKPSPSPTPTPTSSTSQQTIHELQTIHSAMRKLREGITSSARRDVFAQSAYIFIIRAAILTNTPATYHPALLYLLHTIHRAAPLPAPELAEFVRYRVLDMACRVGDLRAAREVAMRGFGGVLKGCTRTRQVLSCLTRGDWVAFWRLRKAVDGYQLRLLGWAEEGVRWHALKCLGRSYFGAQRAYVERAAGLDWEGLVKEGVGWELKDEEWVVIRKPKGK